MQWSPATRTEVPLCFGKSWERNDPICAGGVDPAFSDANGGHVRERCGSFESCGARFQASKMEQSRALIPAPSLVRPWTRPAGNPQPIPPVSATPQQFSGLIQQIQQIVARGATPQGPAPVANMMPVNFHIPQYLTVREERQPGESVFRMLGRELFRSMGKSIGHTLGNFFDTTPLIWKDPPKE